VSSSPLANFLPELERLVAEAPVSEVPALLGDMERLRARLWLRVGEALRPAVPAPPAPVEPDRLISTQEAAGILGVTARWLYGHADQIPGTQRLSRRCLRFSERKLRRWLAQRSP
jgi:predicted DNA-binding transcriptional regulator AlpA